MTKGEVSNLREIYRHCTMQHASFLRDHDFEGAKALTADIRELTRIWRSSWILGPLADLIRKHDPEFTCDPWEDA